MTVLGAGPLPAPPPVSQKTVPMAGLLVDVYGLEELSSPRPATRVTCLWLHHPRLQTREKMGDFARRAVSAWNERRRGAGGGASAERGLVALAFDQRNHGSRAVCERANGSWRAGNETHGIDMMAAVRGMAEDTRGLMDVVEGYLGMAEGEVDGHFVLGHSLGGHSAWQLMFADERVTAGVVIIGCPDYIGKSPTTVFKLQGRKGRRIRLEAPRFKIGANSEGWISRGRRGNEAVFKAC